MHARQVYYDTPGDVQHSEADTAIHLYPANSINPLIIHILCSSFSRYATHGKTTLTMLDI